MEEFDKYKHKQSKVLFCILGYSEVKLYNWTWYVNLTSKDSYYCLNRFY